MSGTSVADALAAFLETHRMDRGGYRRRVFLVRLGPITLPFPNPRFLALHDLHHVALDVPPTFWGEVEVSAFELRSGCPSALIALLCVGALAFGALVAPRRVLSMWARYKGARNLYRPRVRLSYEELLALPLSELRGLTMLEQEEEAIRC